MLRSRPVLAALLKLLAGLERTVAAPARAVSPARLAEASASASPAGPTAAPAAAEPARPEIGPAVPTQQGTGPASPERRPPPPQARPAVPAPVRISDDPRPTLAPETFIETLRAADRYLQIAENGGWPSLPPASLKLGDRGPGVAALRERLAITGDLAPDGERSDSFDAGLAAAVKRFQFRHGLPETGIVGARTLAALNVPAIVRYRQLAASAQRLIGSAFPFGERYVVVNIPSAAVEAVSAGRVVRRYVAVVGKKDRPSPKVETRITNINFNPTWTVPVSLIKKDIIPHMRKDAAYLAKMKIRILDGQAQEVDPARIDWATERAVNYTLRQDPGADNSLGQIRIDMPNRHAVYMHDTPSKRLFARGDRFHSSGCVRVADVRAFVAWLLEGTLGPNGPWTQADIEAAIASGKRYDVRLARPVPVAWVYLTGYATADGIAHFRDDIYELDSHGLPPPPPADAMATAAIARPPAPGAAR